MSKRYSQEQIVSPVNQLRLQAMSRAALCDLVMLGSLYGVSRLTILSPNAFPTRK